MLGRETSTNQPDRVNVEEPPGMQTMYLQAKGNKKGPEKGSTVGGFHSCPFSGPFWTCTSLVFGGKKPGGKRKKWEKGRKKGVKKGEKRATVNDPIDGMGWQIIDTDTFKLPYYFDSMGNLASLPKEVFPDGLRGPKRAPPVAGLGTGSTQMVFSHSSRNTDMKDGGHNRQSRLKALLLSHDGIEIWALAGMSDFSSLEDKYHERGPQFGPPRYRIAVPEVERDGLIIFGGMP
ncbi:hypothetical protein B0H16DRAFT_1462589 [Mycena metata]|uniref:Uncharacterized protein n=1 Tax=Mycena metata TaxID=1033252 RepID=A0AAD7IM51_9AGAR|nr:hypothetical protein B0H16DRAFT_1462589 [Mycena metata]